MTVYFRNPDRYTKAVGLSDISHFSFDLGYVKRHGVDFLKWGKLFLNHIPNWDMLVIAREGVAAYNKESTSKFFPYAVYPAWHPLDGFEKLEDYARKPVGEDESLIKNREIPAQFRPRRNQPHKVVVYSSPNMASIEGGQELRKIMEIARKYPECEFIMHDTTSFRLLFAAGFSAGITDPYQSARKGSILLPSGTCTYPDKAEQRWLRVLGYTKQELEGEGDKMVHERVMYNIESLHWAESNFNRVVDFSLRATQGIDITSKDGKYQLEQEREIYLTSGAGKANKRRIDLKLGEDDGYACDHCSIAKSCKFYREGMVCGVPKGKTHDLTKVFGTRDSSVIIDGLVELTEIQASRLQKDLEEEDATGERSMDTDKRIKDLMDAGVKVAKLINPKLNGGGATVNVGFMGQVGGTVSQMTPQEMTAQAVRALEQQGVKREDITPAMIRGLFEGVNDRALLERTVEAAAEGSAPRVIEG